LSYQPHVPAEREAMLAAIGAESVEALFGDIPEAIRNPHLDVPEGLSEPALYRHLKSFADRNQASDQICFLGAGAYDHYVPAAVDELSGRGEFYTGYTPYQPEMTQGILQAIYEYQTMIAELCGLDVANASLYDGATATWEALLMSERQAHQGRFLLASSVHPAIQAAVQSYAKAADYAVEVIGQPDGRLDPAAAEQALEAGASALVVQYPSFFGTIEDATALAELAHAKGALLVVVANPLALALLKSPGEMGADICVGEGQPLGIPLQYGGPYLGFMATTQANVRKMPGRLVGATVDGEGRRGFVLTLQAREQHIRREKATSNVCTNQALMALRATIFMTLLGKEGLRDLAEVNLRHAAYLRGKLLALPNVSALRDGPHFHEFAITVPDAAKWHAVAADAGYLAGLVLDEQTLLLCATEQRTRAEMDGLVEVFAKVGA